MNDQLLATFIALVNFDQEIRNLQDERELSFKTRRTLDEQKALLIAELEALKHEVHDLKKDVDEKELAMKVLDQQETEKKRRLETVSSSKEYSSLKSEINAINEQQRTHESGLIDAWNTLDATQKKYVSEQVNVQKKIEDLERNAQELDQKIESITLSIDNHEKERARFVEVVPTDLLNDYEHMRGLVINPVVPVVHNSCSACFYPIPAQDLAILRKGKLLPCKSCYRILYIEDSVQE